MSSAEADTVPGHRNGDRPDTRRENTPKEEFHRFVPPAANESRAERVDRAILEGEYRFGHIARELSAMGKRLDHLDATVDTALRVMRSTNLHAASQPPSPRPPAASLVDLEEAEEQTLGGTRKLMGSRGKLESIIEARAEWRAAEMIDQRMDRRFDERDKIVTATHKLQTDLEASERVSRPVRAIVVILVRHRWHALTAAAAIVLAKADTLYVAIVTYLKGH